MASRLRNGRRRWAWADSSRRLFVRIACCEGCDRTTVFAQPDVREGPPDIRDRVERVTEWRFAWKGWTVSSSLHLLCPRCSADPRAEALAALRRIRSLDREPDTRRHRLFYRTDPIHSIGRFAGWLGRLG